MSSHWPDKIYLGADHRGYPMKQKLIEHLRELGLETEDLGTDSTDSVDYPDYAQKVAEAVAGDAGSAGVLVCGSGIGVCMAANKVKGARGAPVYDLNVAEMTRRHNDANIACFSGDWQDYDAVVEYLEKFLETDFEGGRHQRRVDKMERKGC